MDDELSKEFADVLELLRSKDVDEVKRRITTDNRLLEFMDSSGRLLIHWAASSGCLSIIEYIITTNEELVAKLDESQWDAFMIAVSAGHLDVVKCLFSSHHIDVNHK